MDAANFMLGASTTHRVTTTISTMRDLTTISGAALNATGATPATSGFAAESSGYDHLAANAARSWGSITRRASALGIAGGGAVAAWFTHDVLVCGLIIGGVVVLPVLVAMLIAATSTNEKRQWAAASTLHMVFAFLTANFQQETKLVPPLRAPERPLLPPAAHELNGRIVAPRQGQPIRHRRRRVAGR